MANIPKQIKNNLFVIGEKIGSGAFGVVHRAIRKNRQEEIAIKFEEMQAETPYLEHEIGVSINHCMYHSLMMNLFKSCVVFFRFTAKSEVKRVSQKNSLWNLPWLQIPSDKTCWKIIA